MRISDWSSDVCSSDLGTGIDQPYPRANAGLYARIAERGAVVSEYLPGTGVHRGHFPARNRLIAGLSLGVLVVEAAERSGALHTARLASEDGRDVFAVPGQSHRPMPRGCHRPIRAGRSQPRPLGKESGSTGASRWAAY